MGMGFSVTHVRGLLCLWGVAVSGGGCGRGWYVGLATTDFLLRRAKPGSYFLRYFWA